MITHKQTRRAGFTLVETAIAATLFGLVVMGIVMVSVRDDQMAKSTLTIGVAEVRAQQMLAALQDEFVHARGAAPRAVLTVNLASNDTTGLTVDSTLGFPNSGILLIDRGNGSVERLSYSGLDGTGSRFLGLARGLQCTTAGGHGQGADVLWGGLAEPILLQQNPSANLFDGRARGSTGPVFFRGDGTGFSYRVPVDPAGGDDYLVGGDVRWGATVGNLQTATGWAAVVFEPRFTYEEATIQHDLNADGDTADTFDVGQLRRRTWNTADATIQASDLGLGPTVIVQERCNWGGDLNGDGFDDPMFLWDANTRRLHVKIHVLGMNSTNAPIMRAVETTVFLRNVPES